MAPSIADRLSRLESQKKPPAPKPNPGMPLLLKLLEHERHRLDYNDRLHNPRFAEGAAGEGPGPLELTLEERRDLLESAERFLETYLPGQREQDHRPEIVALLDDAESKTLKNIQELREQIVAQELIEGS